MKILKKDNPDAKRLPNEDDLEVGQWYWVKNYETVYDEEKDEWTDEERETEPWLGCIVRVGSNFVKLEGIGCSQRFLFEDFDEWCTPENDPDSVIQGKIGYHQDQVRQLMDKVKQLTAKLGIAPRAELQDGNQQVTQALVKAHGTPDIKGHKAALIKAKEKTLPDLFKKIKDQNEEMANWMQAQLIPLKAETKKLETRTDAIEDRIFTVELYAGLSEELVKIKDGEPASNDEKISDRWLLKKTNLDRILPKERCVVAFRIRRETKERHGAGLEDFINIAFEEQADKETFLYIRNGEQIFRLSTSIDFGEQLFPDTERSDLLSGGALYIKRFGSSFSVVISEARYQEVMGYRLERLDRYHKELAEWKKKPKKKRGMKPWEPTLDFDNYEPCTPGSTLYDDAMEEVAKAAKAHNRVAVVLQGLLDRSPAFQPHPPWQLWTPEGFVAGIELIHDQSRAITDGDAPDFEEYRASLNSSLEKGSNTVGQQDQFEIIEAEKEYKRQCADYRNRNPYHWGRYTPYGNEGPGLIAKLTNITRKGTCTWTWQRDRKNTKWIDDPDQPGYMKIDETGIKTQLKLSSSKILNVDAYKPGDFRMFYADPRTRAMYLKWAPLLLAAEDFHASKKPKKKRKKRRR
jgi:hypothetical protein